MFKVLIVVFLLVESFRHSATENSATNGNCESFESVPDSTESNVYTAVVGGKAFIPCNITAPSSDGRVYVVLWFRLGKPIPLLTLDARSGGTLQQTPQEVSDTERKDRLYFNVTSNPPFLQIKPVESNDAGGYRCRVDFKNQVVNNVVELRIKDCPTESPDSSEVVPSTSTTVEHENEKFPGSSPNECDCPRGPPGLPGPPGKRGLPGLNGPNGIHGNMGMKGLPGEFGLAGFVMKGVRGDPGIQGSIGDPGLPGWTEEEVQRIIDSSLDKYF